MKNTVWGWGVAAVVAVALAGRAMAVEPKEKEEAVTVELFAGMKSGDIEVRMIPTDATVATIIFKNNLKKPVKILVPAALGGKVARKQEGPVNTLNKGASLDGRPLNIGLPDGFEGLPILAQINNGGNNNRNNNNNGGGNQAMGMGGMGGGMMGGGMGGGMMGGGGFAMNVPAEKVMKIKVPGMCLQFGKPDPNPRVAYDLVPITAVTDKPEVAQICAMLGRGEISQNLAQACAWHLMDGLTWDQLAALPKVKHLNGTTEPWFSVEELHVAIRVTQEAGRRAKLTPATSPGETPTTAAAKP
jgi:hypothetical protein